MITQGKATRHKESHAKEEVEYFDREMTCFQAKGQRYNKSTWNSR